MPTMTNKNNLAVEDEQHDWESSLMNDIAHNYYEADEDDDVSTIVWAIFWMAMEWAPTSYCKRRQSIKMMWLCKWFWRTKSNDAFHFITTPSLLLGCCQIHQDAMQHFSFKEWWQWQQQQQQQKKQNLTKHQLTTKKCLNFGSTKVMEWFSLCEQLQAQSLIKKWQLLKHPLLAIMKPCNNHQEIRMCPPKDFGMDKMLVHHISACCLCDCDNCLPCCQVQLWWQQKRVSEWHVWNQSHCELHVFFFCACHPCPSSCLL